MIWKYLSDIWQVLTRCYLRPQQWVFSQYAQNGSNDEMEILLQFLRYWGLQHNCNMRNAFKFDNRHGVKAQRYSHVEFLDVRACGDHFLNAYSDFLMALHDIPLPT